MRMRKWKCLIDSGHDLVEEVEAEVLAESRTYGTLI